MGGRGGRVAPPDARPLVCYTHLVQPVSVRRVTQRDRSLTKPIQIPQRSTPRHVGHEVESLPLFVVAPLLVVLEDRVWPGKRVVRCADGVRVADGEAL